MKYLIIITDQHGAILEVDFKTRVERINIIVYLEQMAKLGWILKCVNAFHAFEGSDKIQYTLTSSLE